MEKEKFIHFGSRYFDEFRFVPVQNLPHRNKPKGGLWASSTKTDYGWYEWSRDNDDFGHCRFTNAFLFELKPETRILRLDAGILGNSIAEMKASFMKKI